MTRLLKSVSCVVLSQGLLALSGCGKGAAGDELSVPSVTTLAKAASNSPASKQTRPAFYTYDVVNVFPHDPHAFTQGLVFLNGQLLESTGLNGQSTLRRVELKTGRVLQQVDVAPQFFAEGLAVLNQKAYQLTWQTHKAFVYDLESFRPEREFPYPGEGWGLTTDGASLILSDGTSQLRFLDPENFTLKRTLTVRDRTWPVDRLNELEYIRGEIFANIWGADYVVRINPETGTVTGIVDFTGLLPVQDRTPGTDVLNGIAYDSTSDHLFVTGKRWPKLFEVRLRPR